MKFRSERQRLVDRKWDLYRRQRGKCHWCGRKMEPPERVQRFDQRPLLATLDHLDDRVDGNRGKMKGERTVLACYECNHRRGRESSLKAVESGKATKRFHPSVLVN